MHASKTFPPKHKEDTQIRKAAQIWFFWPNILRVSYSTSNYQYQDVVEAFKPAFDLLYKSARRTWTRKAGSLCKVVAKINLVFPV